MTDGPLPDHYATLGVVRTASVREIRAARRRLLGLHHPDVSEQEAEAAKRATISILLAGEVLLDPKARAAYDAELARASGIPGAAGRARGGRDDAAHATGGRDLHCATCGRVNVRTRRDYCIFCGAGIGDTPRPITLAHVRYTRDRWDSTGGNAGCGFLVGTGIGLLLVFQLASVWLPGMMAVVMVPALLFAYLAHRYRDEFWEKLTGLFR